MVKRKEEVYPIVKNAVNSGPERDTAANNAGKGD